MRRNARRGFTLLEIIVVLAVLLILGAVIVPAMSSYHGNAHQKAAADGIRARLADARAKAMQDGTWYRLAVHEDKTRIRLAPDGPDFASITASEVQGFDSKVTEDKFEDGVTAELILDSDDQVHNDSGWLTIATVGPEGICKEDGVMIAVKESTFAPIQIRVRGVIGNAKLVKPARQNGGEP
jgi:prepilin-type N-terminal cleavage/methylation domain-containing protein